MWHELSGKDHPSPINAKFEPVRAVEKKGGGTGIRTHDPDLQTPSYHLAWVIIFLRLILFLFGQHKLLHLLASTNFRHLPKFIQRVYALGPVLENLRGSFYKKKIEIMEKFLKQYYITFFFKQRRHLHYCKCSFSP